MGLPLSKRGSRIGTYLPNKDAIFACFKIATTPEAADYMVKQFEKVLKNTNMMEKFESVFLKVKEFAKNVHLQRDSRNDPWAGKIEDIKTDFQNFQHHLANETAKALKTAVKGDIKMDFAISDKSELRRAFGVAGQTVKPEVASIADKLFNTYLAENNMISKGGVIYEANDHGEIQKDLEDNPVLADPEKVKQMIANDFPQYLEAKGVKAITQRHDYPTQGAKPAAQATQKPAPAKPTVAPEISPEETPEPEAPSTGSSMGG